MPRPNGIFIDLVPRIRALIQGSVAHGEAVSSQRKLAEAFGVSHDTARRVLVRLAEEGLVRPFAQSCWKRCDPQPKQRLAASQGKRPRRVGLISRRPRDEALRRDLRLYFELEAEAQRRGMEFVWVPHVHRHRPTAARSRIDFDRVPWNQFEVGLLLEVEDALNLSDPVLQRQSVLAVDWDATEFGIPSVTYDDRHVGRLAARTLVELGHRRLAVTDEINPTGRPAESTWMARRHGFEAAAGSFGAFVRPEWRLVSRRFGYGRRPDPWAEERAWVEHFLRKPPKDRPTALFGINPRAVGFVLEELTRNGLQIPRELSVILVAYEPPQGLGLAFTYLKPDLNALARRAIDAAEALMARPGNPLPALTAPFEFVSGASLSPPVS